MCAKMFQQPFVGGDWLIREDDDSEYNRIHWLYDNTGGGSAIVLPAGYPVKITYGTPNVYNLAVKADVDLAPVSGTPTVNAATLEPYTIPAGEKKMLCLIARGFNVVDNNFLPTADYTGAAFAAGAGGDPSTLPPHYRNTGPNKQAWKCANEPTNIQEQAT